MLIQKKLLEQLIELASDSAEYLNSGEHWITVKPHGEDSKGTHVLVKDGETSKEAVERKFGSKQSSQPDYLKSKEDYFKKFSDLAKHTFNFQHKNKVIDAVVEGKMTKEKALELHSKDYPNLEKDIDYRIKDTKESVERQKQTKEVIEKNKEVIEKAKQEKITEKEKELQEKQTMAKEEMIKTPLNEYLKQSGFKRKNILDLLAYDHYEAVKKAKESGIKISADVLKDYPDLAD